MKCFKEIEVNYSQVMFIVTIFEERIAKRFHTQVHTHYTTFLKNTKRICKMNNLGNYKKKESAGKEK